MAYPGPDGQTRVEFATGPYGRVTWMVDLDAAGKVSDAPEQVLNEARFSWVQQNARDRDSNWLLYNLGRPGEVMRLGWIGGQVWSWRYPTFDCLWFQVTVNDDGSLRDAGGYGIDPRCDAPSDRVDQCERRTVASRRAVEQCLTWLSSSTRSSSGKSPSTARTTRLLSTPTASG